MIRRRALALPVWVVLTLGVAPLRAQDAGTAPTVIPQESTTYRSTGMAELGMGWLVLPGAKVCSARSRNSCSRGDSSPMIEVWPLVRPTRAFALGAGISLGLIPTTDAPRQDPPGVHRDHSRGYLTIESVGRYYPIAGDSVEAWVGLTAGLVVVSDTFKSQNRLTDKALVGPRGVTIRTEGYTVGLAAGGSYLLTPHWSVGTTLRYGSWCLPRQPATDSFGDEASLVGRSSVFSLSLNVAYRIAI